MTNITDRIKSQDMLASSIASGLHFNGDKKYKTTLGGVVSIFIKAFMFYYTANNAYRMMIHENPYIISLSRALDFENDPTGTKIYPLEYMTKLHFEIVDRKWTRYKFEETAPYLTMEYI